jgi:DNA uptake protein ComE-like DNA-binding protein
MEAMIGGRGTGCKAPGPAGFARRADAALLAAVLAGGLVLCGARALERGAALAAAGPAPEPAAVEHRVDLAAAGTTELQLLPGVGPRLAERIAAERAARGPFDSLDDVVRRVPGVGPARVRSWRGRVVEPRGGSR